MDKEYKTNITKRLQQTSAVAQTLAPKTLRKALIGSTEQSDRNRQGLQTNGKISCELRERSTERLDIVRALYLKHTTALTGYTCVLSENERRGHFSARTSTSQPLPSLS